MKKQFYYLACLGLALLSAPAFAQEAEQKKDEDIYELSLEELMNIPIQSASKKDETLFDAPLSSYTITQADIEKAGSTSIMEALRLAPGVIVRQQTNGIYDIHIRGFDNLLRRSEDYTKSNLSTLVMIDNRPVFNHNLGGTFWETLPVDLNDVERIEIVRGPSAPLFGPNAVTGVINIITKRIAGKTFANASLQYGTPSTMLANGSFGKSVSEKFSFGLSTNYQQRDRFDDTYFNPATGDYLPVDQITSTPTEEYPNYQRSMKKVGVNSFFNFKANEQVAFDLSLGLQTSEVQKNFLSGANNTPFTTSQTQSQYANLSGKVYGLTLRSSYLNGHDNLNVGSPPNQYDYQVADVFAEYEINAGKKVTIVPGVNYQYAGYGDADYVKDGSVFLNGKKVTINTSSAFLRTDIKPIENLRIIAAVRADKFSVPNKTYLAYEFATTYKLNPKNLLRAAFTRSNSGSFIGNNFLDLNIIVPNAIAPGVNATYSRLANQNLNLSTVDMIEFGYRSQITKNLQLDLDVFSQKIENLSALIFKGFNGNFADPRIIEQFENIPTTASQLGTTIGINFVPNEKFQFKPFLTIQQTKAYKVLDSYDNSTATTDDTHKSTPTYYGGYYLNYKPGKKLNFNLNGYYFASHVQYGRDGNRVPVNFDVKGKFLVDFKASYNLTQQLSGFVNARNALNNNSREYYGTDKIGGLYLVGLSFKMN